MRLLFRMYSSREDEVCADHLPGNLTYKEIEEMIETVDRNRDGKLSFSEFREVLNTLNVLKSYS